MTKNKNVWNGDLGIPLPIAIALTAPLNAGCVYVYENDLIATVQVERLIILITIMLNVVVFATMIMRLASATRGIQQENMFVAMIKDNEDFYLTSLKEILQEVGGHSKEMTPSVVTEYKERIAEINDVFAEYNHLNSVGKGEVRAGIERLINSLEQDGKCLLLELNQSKISLIERKVERIEKRKG